MRTERVHRAELVARAGITDLALVGEIAVLMDSRPLSESIEAALLRLQEYSRAEACELFLATPRGREMILVSHEGRDLEAFCQQKRFQAGVGFPGIVLRAAAPLVSDRLQSEVHFVRSRVTFYPYGLLH